MKLLVILFSALFVAVLFDVGPAVSQTAPPSQAAHQQALDDCHARYAGSEAIAAARGLTAGRARGDLWRDRWAFVEACFKETTGMYPFQTNVKCNLPYRRFRSLRCLRKMSLLSTIAVEP